MSANLPVLGVDVGGTFTDFVYLEDGRPRIDKQPSTPADPARAVLAGLQRLDGAARAQVAHGTTVATNALLERRGARTLLVTTRGFADVLRLGRGERRALYSLAPADAPCLVDDGDVIEVDERLGPGGRVWRALSQAEVERVAREVAARDAPAVAVCLLYAFADASHEQRIASAVSASAGEAFLSLSSEVLPEMREYERASTTVINAYLGPVVAAYLRGLRAAAAPRRLWVMGSHGGVLPPSAAARWPVSTLLSGPAAGVAGAMALARAAGIPRILSFDMGGTSTDVALCEGQPPLTAEAEIDGLPVGSPMVDVHTIGAGGGSIVSLDAGGALRVGPRSAGADPGPACYGRGGTLPTVTDANAVLGRLPTALPLAAGLRLDPVRAEAVLAPLADRAGRSVQQLALAVVAVAEAQMERALRRVSIERGRDPAEVVLLPFGGAGGLHACALAEALRMDRVVVPAHPGTLSAAGLLLTPRAAAASRTVLGAGGDSPYAPVWPQLERRAVDTLAGLEEEGSAAAPPALDRGADLRYRGQSATLYVPWPHDVHGRAKEGEPALRALAAAFEQAHQRHYGYRSRVPVEIVTLRVRATLPPLLEGLPTAPVAASCEPAPRWAAVTLADGHRVRAPLRAAALLEDPLPGPAIVHHGDATTWLAPGWVARRMDGGHLQLDRSR